MYIVYNKTKKAFVLRFPQYVQNSEKKVYLYNKYLNKKINTLIKNNNLTCFELENIKKIIGCQLLDIGQVIDLKIASINKIKKVLILKKKLAPGIFAVKYYCIRSKRLIKGDIKNGLYNKN